MALLAVVVVVPVMVTVAAALHHLDLDQQGLLKQNNLNNHGVYAVLPSISISSSPSTPSSSYSTEIIDVSVSVSDNSNNTISNKAMKNYLELLEP